MINGAKLDGNLSQMTESGFILVERSNLEFSPERD